MLKLLHIENIAVIEKTEIEFAAGLNILTGETGTGKSIVIDSLSAVTGGRVSRDIIRTGASSASVTAVFSNPKTSLWLEENGIEPDDDDLLFISRKIASDGKSSCRINGKPVSAAQLRELGAGLLDIHGQNDGRKLLDESAHLAYLDLFGSLGMALDEYKVSYQKLTQIQSEIEKLSMDETEKIRRIDTLKHQLEEIERAKISIGEQSQLQSRRALLLNSSKLTESVEDAFEALYGGDNSDGAITQLTEAFNRLSAAARFSEDFLQPLTERLNDLIYTAQDISDELRDFRARLDFSPNELDELETRLDLLKRIERKYGGEEQALDYFERGKTELANITDSESKINQLNAEFESVLNDTKKLAESLTVLRKKAALTLQERIMKELAELNMPGVVFMVEFGAVQGDYGLGANGCDDVRFLMSANAGEKPGRINRIASGGELARIMLALKNVLLSDNDTNSMVFDEIDTGVSGITAQRVGEKLARLAQSRQVLCVTHLPQIAVMADVHFEIEKNISDGRTYTQVTKLDFEGRKKELARLSGGENITATTLTSAEEQLTAAENYKRNI